MRPPEAKSLDKVAAWKMSEVPMDPRSFEWDLQPRVFNFILGVILPLPLLFELIRISLLIPLNVAKAVMLACTITIIASSAGLAAHCLFPEMGKLRWVRVCVRTGLFFWTPVAFLWCAITFMLALLASLLVAVVIKLGAKAIAPLYVEGSRYTLKQVFWLTTLSALVLAALAPWIRSSDNLSRLLFAVHVFIILATPVLTGVTFSTVALELQDVKSERSLSDAE